MLKYARVIILYIILYILNSLSGDNTKLTIEQTGCDTVNHAKSFTCPVVNFEFIRWMFIQNLFTSPSKIKTYIITNRTSLVCNLNHGVYISGLNRFINKYQIKSYYVLTTLHCSWSFQSFTVGELETNRW